MYDPTVNLENITIDPLHLSHLGAKDQEVHVLRLDKMHPEISGNKWFKLKYYLEISRLEKKKRLISFGGAYSNHIVAVACAAHAHGLASTGIIRGEGASGTMSPALFTAGKYGMEIQFISRESYRKKDDPDFLTILQTKYPEALIIPEGGQGEPGLRGAEEILSFPGIASYTHICCAVGTGTTIAGMVNAAGCAQQLIGISVLKGTSDLEPVQPFWIKDPAKLKNLTMIHDYHFGGYAKKTSGLLDFMNELYELSGIPTDFVYTGKLFYAVSELLKAGYFPERSRILVIHTGGLHGNLSLPPGTLHF